MDRLPSVRDDVREGPTVALSAVTFAYRITIADLVSLRETVAQADGGSAELLGEIRAAGALSRATEYSARLQIEVLQAIAAGGGTTPADQQAIMSTRAGYREAMAFFDELAPAQWQDWLDHALTGPDVQVAQGLEDQVARAPVGTSLQLDTTRWITATREQIALLHQVERQVDESIRAEVEQVYGGKLAWVVAEAAVVLVALMLAVVLAIGQSRSMISRLRALAGAARITAFVSLPQTVERLRAIGPQTIDPDAFANQAEAPMPDAGSDEIADVSQAFLAVHRQAIITAADLANMRAGLSQILLHLARRNQRLVGGLIRELDGAERGEEDPDRLAALFRLDQLATRMGRYNDNLLIMGGQTASRVDAADVALDTVFRGAQSKIERYQRIRTAAMHIPIFVRGTAVHDLTNLLAELLDNATQFSEPDSVVDVAAGIADGRVVIQVRDSGVGIPLRRLEQFNHILAIPPAIDVSAVRSMGLTVVAHIAARHAILVRLTPGARGGTIAHVIVPREVCEVPGYTPPPDEAPSGRSNRSHPDRTGWAQTALLDPPIYRGVAAHFSWFQHGGAAVGAGETGAWLSQTLAGPRRHRPPHTRLHHMRTGSHTQDYRGGHRWRTSCPVRSRMKSPAWARPTTAIRRSSRPRSPPSRRAMRRVARSMPTVPGSRRTDFPLNARPEPPLHPPHRSTVESTRGQSRFPVERLRSSVRSPCPACHRSVIRRDTRGGDAWPAQDRAEQLAAFAAGLIGLVGGTARCLEAGAVINNVTELEQGFVLSMAVSTGASLLALAGRGSDLALVSFEMAELINRVGHAITPDQRFDLFAAM